MLYISDENKKVILHGPTVASVLYQLTDSIGYENINMIQLKEPDEQTFIVVQSLQGFVTVDIETSVKYIVLVNDNTYFLSYMNDFLPLKKVGE